MSDIKFCEREIPSEFNNFTVLPIFVIFKVTDYFDANNIDYLLMNEPEFLDFVEPSCNFKGRIFNNHIKCLATKMPTKEVIALAEKLDRCSSKDIGKIKF